jgi:hypothetical protein
MEGAEDGKTEPEMTREGALISGNRVTIGARAVAPCTSAKLCPGLSPLGRRSPCSMCFAGKVERLSYLASLTCRLSANVQRSSRTMKGSGRNREPFAAADDLSISPHTRSKLRLHRRSVNRTVSRASSPKTTIVLTSRAHARAHG